MPTISETGHANNVAKFEMLISFCNGYGAMYNPSKNSLTIAQLTVLQHTANQVLQQTITTKANFDIATNARITAFKDLKPLSTKIVNALVVSGASTFTVADAKTINKKIQGVRATAKVTPPDAPADANTALPIIKTISASQLSYESIIEHLSKLLATITQEPSYQPNEIELKTITITARLNLMQTTNTALLQSYTNWSNARILRDDTLYNAATGLVKTTLEVKNYIKSVFGATSPQYKQVGALLIKIIAT